MAAELRRQLKDRKCEHRPCRKVFTPERPGQKACSAPCALAAFRAKQAAAAERKAKRERRAANVAKREGLERLKSLNAICVDAQGPVNLYVRIRDFAKGCISCPTGKVEDAGHFFPIGQKYRNNRIRFDTRLIHGQCRKCNSYEGGGNLHGYIAGIRSRYGEEYLATMYEIKAQCDRGELSRLTKDEARQIGVNHRRMARELGRASNAVACA